MGLIAEYEVSCAHLPLVDVAAALPAVTLSVEVGQPNQGGLPPFVVRVSADASADVEEAFVDADFVEAFARVGRSGRTARYQVIPARGMEEQLGAHVDNVDQLRDLAGNASIVEDVEATPTGWIQRRWFADRDAFDEYRRFWQRNGEGFSLRQLTRDDGEGFSLRQLTRDDGEGESGRGRQSGGSGGDGRDGDGLTERQREALLVAHEMGYFEIPRTAALGDVAAELGISAASASERLRRAQSELVESSVDAGGLGDRHLNGLSTESTT